MAANFATSDSSGLALPSVLDLVSKLDSKRYSCIIKTDCGKISLEILDKFEQSSGGKSSSLDDVELKTGVPDFGSRRRHFRVVPPRFQRESPRFKEAPPHRARTEQKQSTGQVVTLETKPKRKSPSEKGRDSCRLQNYISQKENAHRTGDKHCQTSLETSDKLIQTATLTCEKQSQTFIATFNPPRLESSALKVARSDDLLVAALESIHTVSLQKKIIKSTENYQQDLEQLRKIESEQAEARSILAKREIALLNQEKQLLTSKLDTLQHQLTASSETQGPLPDPTSCWNPVCNNTGCTKKCTACHIAVYCSRACQKAHWKQHKNESCSAVNAKN